MRNLGVDNMFQTSEYFLHSDKSWICNNYLITYLFYVTVECVNSLLYFCYTLSNYLSSRSERQKDYLKIICDITDNHILVKSVCSARDSGWGSLVNWG